jgi:hypothetical protein
MPQQLLETIHSIGQITTTFFVAANGMLSQTNCASTWGRAGRFRRGGGAQMLKIPPLKLSAYSQVNTSSILEL